MTTDRLSRSTVTAADGVAIPTVALVVRGDRDWDNGSGEALAARLANGRLCEVPGDHLTAVVSPDLPRAILDFLG